MAQQAKRTVGDVLMATAEFVQHEAARANDPTLDATTQGVAKIRAAAQQELLDFMSRSARGEP
jgi:hypothetical protein